MTASPDPRLLVYGVTGYTGALISRTAAESGLPHVVAGRNEAAVKAHAAQVGQPARAFGLDDDGRLDEALAGVTVVLNAAGPFRATCEPLVRACIRAGAHYLDIAGEVPEFEAVYQHSGAAAARGVMLMPGVGFGVVPTDVVAVALKERLPDATHLDLSFETVGGVSRGTLTTLFHDIHRAGFRRVEGELVPARPAAESRTIDLGNGPVRVVLNPWRADLLTAGLSTAIPNITTWTAFPAPVRFLMRSGPMRSWLLDRAAFQNSLNALFRRLPAGPDEKVLREGRTYVLGEARNPQGTRITAHLQGPEAYAFTAQTAVAAARRALAGNTPAGFQTPAQAFGSRFLDGFDGVSITFAPGL